MRRKEGGSMIPSARRERAGARFTRDHRRLAILIGIAVWLGAAVAPGRIRAESLGGPPRAVLSWRHQILSQEDYTRLAVEWGAYVRTHPSDPRALVQWGNALRYSGKSDSSGIAYDRAFQVDSTDAAAIVSHVSRHMIHHGDESGWRLDHTRLLRARDRDPGYPDTYYMLCLTAFRAGDDGLMDDCFRRLVALGDMPQPLYDFGYNILAGAADGAIILTNGDNDTFPPLAAQAKEGFRRDVHVVNISLLNLKWYVHAIRDAGVPIPLKDAEIEALQYREGETIAAQVQKVLYEEVARQGWKTPLYYAVSVPDGNQSAPGARTLTGLLQQVGPVREGGAGTEAAPLDVEATRRLVDRVYRLESMQDPRVDWRRESVLSKLALNYVEILSRLGTSIEERTPPGDGSPYLSRAIAIATFHHHLDIAKAILEEWQKRQENE
jgi:hypothetical protein